MGQEGPLEKEMATHYIPLPGESHGQRNLAGYSPWGLKESDRTERLTFTLCSQGLQDLCLCEKERAIYSCTLARRIPWMEEAGRLQSMGLLRVGHD